MGVESGVPRPTLQQAYDLLHKNLLTPSQADLRRSVSASYYSLFHLLISETIVNWRLDSSRDALGRMFEHSVMKKASRKINDSRLFPFVGDDPSVVRKPKTVAQAFSQLQDKRHIADYDNVHSWTYTEAFREFQTAANAFSDWELVKHQKIAQDYLVSADQVAGLTEALHTRSDNTGSRRWLIGST